MKSDIYVNLIPGMKYWDMCAGEALLQSMMGVVCDANHRPLIYDHTANDFTIMEGIVIAKNKKVFNVSEERLLNNTGHDLSYFHERTLIEVAEYKRKKAARMAAQTVWIWLGSPLDSGDPKT